MSSQQRIRSSPSSMSSDFSIIGKSISLDSKNSTTAIPAPPGGPVLPRYFLLGRALALHEQSERVGRASRKLSPFLPPSTAQSVSETIENAFEVAISSVVAIDSDHNRLCSSIENDNNDDNDDNDDMDGQTIKKYRRDLLKDDMGLFLDYLSRMRNEVHDDSDSQSSDEEDDDFSQFCY